MPARISEKQALAMGISPQERKAGLIDPLLRDRLVTPSQTAVPKSRKKKHRPPAEAPRISERDGPEGTGSLWYHDGKVIGLELDLELLPVPKERARVVRTANNKTVSFTPARTKRFTKDVRAVIDMVMGGRPPLAGPVRLDMTFRMAIPTSWPKWKQEAARDGLIAPTARPDMDNLEKALLDALNERAFVDDAYVVERMARKIFANQPGISVSVVRMRDRMAGNEKRDALSELIRPFDKKDVRE